MVIFSPSNARNPQGTPTLRNACEREYCRCERPITECPNCTQGTTPAAVDITVSGWGGGGVCPSGECNALNGSFTAERTLAFDDCTWQYDYPFLICDGVTPNPWAVAIRIQATPDGWQVGFLFDVFGFPPESQAVTYRQSVTTPFDCCPSHDQSSFTITIDNVNLCTGSGSLTFTITPDCGGGSMGAMFAGKDDCQPEMRRGKPVIAKGRRGKR